MLSVVVALLAALTPFAPIAICIFLVTLRVAASGLSVRAMPSADVGSNATSVALASVLHFRGPPALAPVV